MKGKCINIGKPCDLAISEEIQDADPANFVCKSCGKPLVEVKQSGKDTNVEDFGMSGNSGGSNDGVKKKKVIICAIGAIAVGVGIYLSIFNNGDKNTLNDDGQEIVVNGGKEKDPQPGVGAPQPGVGDPQPGVGDPEPPIPPTPPTNSDYLNAYSLGYGTYTGPAADGVPDGPGGTINVTKAYTFDLKNGGEVLDFAPGDQIVNCKFRNGKLIQGFLKRKKGEGKNFNIGI